MAQVNNTHFIQTNLECLLVWWLRDKLYFRSSLFETRAKHSTVKKKIPIPCRYPSATLSIISLVGGCIIRLTRAFESAFLNAHGNTCIYPLSGLFICWWAWTCDLTRAKHTFQLQRLCQLLPLFVSSLFALTGNTCQGTFCSRFFRLTVAQLGPRGSTRLEEVQARAALQISELRNHQVSGSITLQPQSPAIEDPARHRTH